MLTVLLALGACSNHEGPEGNPSQVPQTATLYHGMIQLGEKLEDPYTVENMRAALTKAYPTKADRIDITATDLYVRFLPVDDDQLKELEGMGLYLMDHPMDYRIVREGDYYRLTGMENGRFTAWQSVSADRDRSLFTLVLTEPEGNPVPLHIRLKGLDPEKQYRLTATEYAGCLYRGEEKLPELLSGAALMYGGLTFPRLYGDYPSVQILLEVE